MLGNLWCRARGSPQSPLEADLRKVTQSETIDAAPKDVFITIIQASHDADSRKEIMRHLQESLDVSAGHRWRRAHGGMVLLEELLRNGSPAMFKEVSQGLHFDPMQRLTFLERFEYTDDRRVQGMMRQKATTLRANLLAKLQSEMPDSPSAGSGAGSQKGSSQKASSPKGSSPKGSPAGLSPRNGSASIGNSRNEGFGSDGPRSEGPGPADADAIPYNPAFPGFGSDSIPPPTTDKGSRNASVNGLVKVGHRDDTDSESDGDAKKRKGKSSPAQGGQERKGRGSGGRDRRADRRRRRDSSSSSSRSSSGSSSSSSGGRRRRRDRQQQRSAAPAPQPKAPPAQQADLLGSDSPAAAAPPKPAAAQVRQQEVLLDMLGEAPPVAKQEVLFDMLGEAPPVAKQEVLLGMLGEAPPVAKQADATDSNLLDF